MSFMGVCWATRMGVHTRLQRQPILPYRSGMSAHRGLGRRLEWRSPIRRAIWPLRCHRFSFDLCGGGGPSPWSRCLPAITRLQDALSEIRQVARLEPIPAAEGAIALLERISPALEHVDSSSGAIGSAVNRTIGELVPVIAGAPVGVP